MQHTTPPTIEDIIALADASLARIPERFREHARPLAVVVEDIADDETLDDMGLESGYDLTGLYRGIPLADRTSTDPAREPDMIVLYREPILLEWIETGDDLSRLIHNVLVHEVAHHFGFTDEDIAALEQGE